MKKWQKNLLLGIAIYFGIGCFLALAWLFFAFYVLYQEFCIQKIAIFSQALTLVYAWPIVFFGYKIRIPDFVAWDLCQTFGIH